MFSGCHYRKDELQLWLVLGIPLLPTHTGSRQMNIECDHVCDSFFCCNQAQNIQEQMKLKPRIYRSKWPWNRQVFLMVRLHLQKLSRDKLALKVQIPAHEFALVNICKHKHTLQRSTFQGPHMKPILPPHNTHPQPKNWHLNIMFLWTFSNMKFLYTCLEIHIGQLDPPRIFHRSFSGINHCPSQPHTCTNFRDYVGDIQISEWVKNTSTNFRAHFWGVFKFQSELTKNSEICTNFRVFWQISEFFVKLLWNLYTPKMVCKSMSDFFFSSCVGSCELPSNVWSVMCVLCPSTWAMWSIGFC